MLSVAHHHVEAGTVLHVKNTDPKNADHLVVKIQFLFGRVLIVLTSTYFAWSHMRSESSFERELVLGRGLLDLLQLILCCAEQSSDFSSNFFRLPFVASDLFGQQIYLRRQADD